MCMMMVIILLLLSVNIDKNASISNIKVQLPSADLLLCDRNSKQYTVGIYDFGKGALFLITK